MAMSVFKDFAGAITMSDHNVEQIVEFAEKSQQKKSKNDDGLAKFDVDRLKSVMKGVENYPALVVSVTGVFRSGKSFLINLMITYLNYMSENGTSDGWVKSNLPIKGIQWAQQKETVTFGIGIWHKPFILRRVDGKEIAVFLIDCQGTGDTKQNNAQLDTLIFYISLQMSNVQIVNLPRLMTAPDITSLQMCAGYADALSNDPKVFDRLIFVQRNWEADDDYGKRPKKEFYGLAGDLKLKEDRSETNQLEGLEADEETDNTEADGEDDHKKGESGASDEIQNAVKGIDKAFKEVDMYAFPHPGKKVARSSESASLCVTDGDIDSEFLEAAKSLFDDVFANPKFDDDLKTTREVATEFASLGSRVKENDLTTMSPIESFLETLAHKAFTKSLLLLDEGLNNAKASIKKDIPSRDILRDLSQLLEQVEAEYKRVYQVDRRGTDSPAYGKYWTLLKKKHTEHADLIQKSAELADERREVLEDKKKAKEAEDAARAREEKMQVMMQEQAERQKQMEKEAKERQIKEEERIKKQTKDEEELKRQIKESKEKAANALTEMQMAMEKESARIEEVGKTAALERRIAELEREKLEAEMKRIERENEELRQKEKDLSKKDEATWYNWFASWF